MTQTVKNSPAMWETWVRSLGWEDPLEKETATHSSILDWRIPRTEETGRCPWCRKESDTTEWLSLFTYVIYKWSKTTKLFCCTYISICIVYKVICFIGKFEIHNSLTFGKLIIHIQEWSRIGKTVLRLLQVIRKDSRAKFRMRPDTHLG